MRAQFQKGGQGKHGHPRSYSQSICLVSIAVAAGTDLGNPGNPRFEAGNSWEPAAFIDQPTSYWQAQGKSHGAQGLSLDSTGVDEGVQTD